MCHMFMGGTLVACRTLQKVLLNRLVLVCEDKLYVYIRGILEAGLYEACTTLVTKITGAKARRQSSVLVWTVGRSKTYFSHLKNEFKLKCALYSEYFLCFTLPSGRSIQW